MLPLRQRVRMPLEIRRNPIPPVRRCVVLAIAAGIVASVGACDLSSPAGLFEAPLREIDLGPSVVLEVGDTTTITAIGYVGGVLGILMYDPLRDAVWRVSDSSIVRLERLPPPAPTDSYPKARVRLRAVAPGRALIVAFARGFADTVTADVEPAAVNPP